MRKSMNEMVECHFGSIQHLKSSVHSCSAILEFSSGYFLFGV